MAERIGMESAVSIAGKLGEFMRRFGFSALVFIAMPCFALGYGVHAALVASPEIARITADAETTHAASIAVERALRRKNDELDDALAQERRWKNELAENVDRSRAVSDEARRMTPVPNARRAKLNGIERSRGSSAFGELVVPEITIWSEADRRGGRARAIGKLPHGATVAVTEVRTIDQQDMYHVRGSDGSRDVDGWVSELFIEW